jgi:hypothetical protein
VATVHTKYHHYHRDDGKIQPVPNNEGYKNGLNLIIYINLSIPDDEK